MPDADLAQYNTFYVAHEPDGKPFVRDLIVEELREKGFTVETGELDDVPIDTEIVVRFQDNWIWDPTAYLGGLGVQFFERDTGLLLATGESMRTTFGQRPARELVTEVIDSMLAGTATAEEPEPLLEITAEDLAILLDDPIAEPLPMRVSVIGLGAHWVSNEALTGGVLASASDNGVFAETAQDDSGDYTLLVAVTLVDWGPVATGMSVETHWQLYRKSDRALVWESRIDASAVLPLSVLIPESLGSIWRKTFSRSVHKIIERGFTQLSELELDSAGSNMQAT